MRNQFFADNRDLFKYDLILEIVSTINSIKQFTFIPMLTDDHGSHGNQFDRDKAKAGFENLTLKNYLDKCIKDKNRNIRHIKEYFRGEDIIINIYKENELLINRDRNSYFSAIPGENLNNSIVFLDPDNGLEIKKSDKKHFLYSEMVSIIKRMNEFSILMIYQHFPRENHKIYINRRLSELYKQGGIIPIFISDNEIIFFFLAKKEELMKQLTEILKEYIIRYPRLLYEAK